MSKDIYLDSNGNIQVADTDVFKSKNIMEIQIGTLIYAPKLGIDLARFIDPSVSIQPETFRSYTVQELVRQGVRVETVTERFNQLSADLVYTVSSTETERVI